MSFDQLDGCDEINLPRSAVGEEAGISKSQWLEVDKEARDEEQPIKGVVYAFVIARTS
jgi:hypothetical protein